MQPVTRARIAAGGMALVGGGLIAFGEWGAGIGVLSVGAAAALLVTDRMVPAELPDCALEGSLAALARLARNLELEGSGFVIPGPTPDAPSRLFIAVSPEVRFEDLPEIEGDHALKRDPSRALGVTILPPGSGLEARWRDVNGLPEGRGAEEAAAHLRAAFPALGLGHDITVARAGAAFRVAYVPLALAGAERAARDGLAPWHLQGGDPAASLAAILVARAHVAPVRVKDAGGAGGRAFVDLEVGARSLESR